MQLLKSLKNTVSNNNHSSSSIEAAEAHNILRNDRRRRVIDFLSEFECGETVAVGDIADNISADGDRTKCYVALIQNHLSVLATDSINVISYDRQAKTVVVNSELFRLQKAREEFEKTLS